MSTRLNGSFETIPEFLHEKRDSNERVYTFKHALTQEVAYQTLIAHTRSQLHQRIAYVLETDLSDAVSHQPELLAHHYTQAGLWPEAVVWWQRAGEHALSQSAYVESLTHATEGLALIDRLPEGPERLHQELNLHLMRALVLQIKHGFGGDEAEAAYRRAEAICSQLPAETPQRLPVLLGLWGVAISRARHQQAHELAAQCLSLARRSQRPAPLIRGHCAFGMTSFYMGEFTLCQEHMDQVHRLYDPKRRRSHSDIHDPGVVGLANVAFALWFQGYPDQALKKSQEALAMARALAHPFTLATALIHATALHQHRREPREAVTLAEELMGMAAAKEFDFWAASARVFQGWGWLALEQTAAGMEGLQQGLMGYRASGSQLYLPYLLMLLAEGYQQTDQTEAALVTLDEALTLAKHSGEYWSSAELYRQQGELLLNYHEPEATQAKSCFTQAIAIARQQGAKMLELRTTVSLARLWLQQDKPSLIRDHLTPLYDWFCEGHTTADLMDAKATLDCL